MKTIKAWIDRYKSELVLFNTITNILILGGVFSAVLKQETALHNHETIIKDLKNNTDITIKGDSTYIEKVESLKDILKKINKNENSNKR